MSEEKLLTVRDVSIILGISEGEVLDLAENGQLPAYKVGGVYLRFKHEQVENFRKAFKPQALKDKHAGQKEYPLGDRVSDFFYFNDFYILSGLIIALVIFIILKSF